MENSALERCIVFDFEKDYIQVNNGRYKEVLTIPDLIKLQKEVANTIGFYLENGYTDNVIHHINLNSKEADYNKELKRTQNDS